MPTPEFLKAITEEAKKKKKKKKKPLVPPKETVDVPAYILGTY